MKPLYTRLHYLTAISLARSTGLHGFADALTSLMLKDYPTK